MRTALALLLIAAPAYAENGWERVREADGVLVQRRAVEGSALHEFMGQGVVQAPLARVMAVIRDAPRRTEWMHNCVESSLVEARPDLQILYNRTGAPWPVSDRDVVLKGWIVFDETQGEARIEFEETSHPKKPPSPGAVRMPRLRGWWRLVPVEGGAHTWVEYRVHADPGGSLPAWIANRVSKELPFRTIEKLRLQVKRAPEDPWEQEIARKPDYRAVLANPAQRQAGATTATP